MKRLWAIPVLAAILAVLCITTSRSVQQFCGDGAARLETAVAQLDNGDPDAAAELLRSVSSDFDAWRRVSSTFLRHSEMDPVQESLAEASACAEIAAWDDFRTACRQAQMRLVHLADNERPTLGNLW